ncbi:MAG: Na+/H+ antiporter subunit E [Leucobacter sp.]
MSAYKTSRYVVRWYELPLLIGLVLMWMAFWQEISWMTLISGVIASVVAMRIFYLPPVELAGRFNPWWALRYLCFFLWNLAVASAQVAWLALRPGPPPSTAIIEVRLRTHSDFLITMVGLTISLIPGSLVVEIDRFGSTLYLHVLNAPTQKYIRQMRHQTQHIEELLIRAVGSRQELEALK